MRAVGHGKHQSRYLLHVHIWNRIRYWIPAWALTWIALALLLTSVPYVAGLLNEPSGKVFTGALLMPGDTFSYYGKMQLGRHGEWLFSLFYTAEPTDHPAPLFMLYIALGHIARLTGLSIPLVYHAACVVCGALLGVAVTRLAMRTLSKEFEQRLAVALVLFTGGWGWLAVVIGGTNVDRIWLTDMWRYEASGPGSITGFPHLALVVVCQIWLVLAGLRLLSGANPRSLWIAEGGAALAALGIALIHPHQLVIPGLILGVAAWRDALQEHSAWSTAAFKALFRKGLLLAGTVVPAALVVVVQLVTIQSEPLIHTWLEGGSPAKMTLVALAIRYGPIWPATLLGVWRVLRDRDVVLYPVVTWLALNLVLSQLPVGVSSRFILGMYAPVAILAAVGWGRCIAPWLETHFPHLIARTVLPVWFSSVALSSVFLLTALMARVGTVSDPDFYMPADDYAAQVWLDDIATLDDVVLCDPDVGNRIPVWVGIHLLVGHGHETLDHDARAEEVARFFDADFADAARIDYLRRYGIDYVYFSPAERKLGDFDPATVSYLSPEFSQGAVTIYAVTLPSASPN